MTWARLDDQVGDNEKISNAGPLGFALHVAAIAWCAHNLTDGFVPRSRVRRLLDWTGVSLEGQPVDGLMVAQVCVANRLWIEDESRSGWWLHDYLDYNPTREKVLADRERGRARAKASADRAKGAPSPEASPEDTPKLREDFDSTSDGPDPDPDPDPDPVKKDLSNRVGVTAPQLTLAAPASSAVLVSDEREPESGVPTTGKRARGSRLTLTWIPSEETQAWARGEGVSEPCGRFLDEFRDFWVGVPGARGVKLDWEATYRNRVRQIAQHRTPQRGRGGGPKGDRQGLDGWTPPTGTDFFGGDT